VAFNAGFDEHFPAERRTPVRILSYTTLFPNEQQPSRGLFVKERLAALAKLADLRVIAPVPWFPRTRALGERYYRYAKVPARETISGLPVLHPRFPVIPRFGKAADGLLLAAGTLRCARGLRHAFPFDLIDAHWAYPDGTAAAILAGRLGIPFSVTVRGDDVNVFFKHWSRRPWIRWSLQKAGVVIALSRELKEILVAGGIPSGKIAVIPNGIDAGAFHPVDRMRARTHLGLPAKSRIVLSVGRIHRSKRFPVIVEAVARLTGRFPDLQIYIVGAPDHEADDTAAILDMAARHNVMHRLHLVGSQDPQVLKYWYGAADIFCLPTAREGSANVLLEAMACGLPCVTTPVGGNPDVVNSADIGTIVAPGVGAMTEALAAGLTREWNLARIAAHGRARTWQSVAAECRDRLEALLK
jgi:glycosyltransferase involved in cell wall biosynthesis